ncbi:metal-sulfur cluster assembly factor [Gorillibacterium sp. sgz5001074]|uniref:metal-sulfur cluster assembly factor n=1 Tax=Gorillibacterium sp. sgz5001074 TaxID=3446695 RepID=UPI003F681D37
MNQEELRQILKSVIDPELGINIVDLGLVYDVSEANGRVYVQMTLTTQGCPLHDTMVGGVKAALLAQPSVREVEVDLVWSPAWTPEHMSEEAKRRLGFGH